NDAEAAAIGQRNDRAASGGPRQRARIVQFRIGAILAVNHENVATRSQCETLFREAICLVSIAQYVPSQGAGVEGDLSYRWLTALTHHERSIGKDDRRRVADS